MFFNNLSKLVFVNGARNVADIKFTAGLRRSADGGGFFFGDGEESLGVSRSERSDNHIRRGRSEFEKWFLDLEREFRRGFERFYGIIVVVTAVEEIWW